MRELMWLVKAVGRSLRRDDRGATMLEYGLVATLIAVVVAPLVAILGPAVSALFAGVFGAP
ncbi:Flp family type IVb pilin [Kribbella sp. NPDC003557]|jgi:pilus assembly protein Flp/PilA|uniref:Flp family type IVb pilin n=1 Tax=Kribbella sp. NPDC003557 TaxID=3154449 RepID=UPI0033A091FE